ncbi:TetR/AcrR family transcriptional regulator [Lichenihabitans sp. Uapishka_5]|uniref:TetR/AcrR family transcriptional regulator n=1 Tax=Lichenihabitans sp. Uapishka_5 TaxID=3037302 RepID=UPI0029E7CD91|nr:TetR/AcrR family transcriptional regulator [Lichenihabitans sp. Uapishka_5]MDX7953544.1 TetR/AcrR family transcriptional regulator [Lichenihabitans sp. Uapishka_5]
MSSKPRRYTGGRPSQAEALRRDERLVEIAAGMFMERGFDATTIDAVAEAASVGKATLYARYKDKGALFAAVFRRQIDRWLAPLGQAAATPVSGSVEDVLLAMSRAMMASALAPEAVAINRILIAQALRFPELAQMAHQEGWQRSIAALAAVLQHFVDDGQISVTNCDLAADLFLSLVVGRQTRLAMLGIDTDPAQVDHRIRAAVRLFLDGVRAC